MTRLPDWLQAVTTLPAASTDAYAAPAFFYSGGEGPCWLAYETARDFLSAPRAFAIVQIEPDDSAVCELNSTYEYDGIVYLDDGSMAEYGWFRLQPSPWECGDEVQHLLLSLSGRRCEFLCQRVVLQDILYHQPSAAAALRHWLATH